MAERLASKILLIGWDAAELSLIMPLIDAGEMPHLERLMNRGSQSSRHAGNTLHF